MLLPWFNEQHFKVTDRTKVTLDHSDKSPQTSLSLLRQHSFFQIPHQCIPYSSKNSFSCKEPALKNSFLSEECNALEKSANIHQCISVQIVECANAPVQQCNTNMSTASGFGWLFSAFFVCNVQCTMCNALTSWLQCCCSCSLPLEMLLTGAR